MLTQKQRIKEWNKKAHTFETIAERERRREAERIARMPRGFFLKEPLLYKSLKGGIK